MKHLIRTLRPEQWYKNLVVFVAIIFAQQPQAWLSATVAFVSFCLLSSSCYIVNDLHDINEDRVHPFKKNRPIASGCITKRAALITASALSVVGLTGLWLVNPNTLLIGLSYLTLVTLYTYRLKPQYYIGLTVVSLGFVLRALAGCTALEIAPSGWLLSCVFVLALLLATAKRERVGTNELSIALLFVYAAYTLHQGSLMILSIAPAGYAILRYLRLQPVKHNPEPLLKDKRLLGAMLLWLVVVTIALHFGGAN